MSSDKDGPEIRKNRSDNSNNKIHCTHRWIAKG